MQGDVQMVEHIVNPKDLHQQSLQRVSTFFLQEPNLSRLGSAYFPGSEKDVLTSTSFKGLTYFFYSILFSILNAYILLHLIFFFSVCI